MAGIAISPAFSKTMLAAHGLLGILFGAAIYLLCFSGTLAVLTHEFEIWETPGGPIVEEASTAALARAARLGFERAQAAGLAHDIYITAPEPGSPRIQFYGSGENGDHISLTADAAGDLHPEALAAWTAFMRDHHYNFNLPAPWGSYLVGIIGTLLLASLISGLVAHRRIIRDAFRLRLGGARRLSNADMHNRIGVWALPFHLIVTLTGSLLGLGGLIIGLLALVAYDGDREKAVGTLFGPQPTADVRPAPLPDILPMVAQIERRTPNAKITFLFVAHAGTAGQIVTIMTAEPGHLARNEGWSFSGDGRFLSKAGLTDGTLGMRIYGMLTPLHFGNYGGIILKLIYFVLGIGLCTVIATGGTIWLVRRREQGGAWPRLERAWAMLLWGQIPAFAIAGIAALTGIVPPLPVYWLLVLSSLAVTIFMPFDPRRIVTSIRLTGAVSMLVLVAVHLATRGIAIQGSLLVDGILTLVAAALLRLVLAPRPSFAGQRKPATA